MSLGTNDIKKRNTKEFFLRNDEKLVDGKQHSGLVRTNRRADDGATLTHGPQFSTEISEL